MIYWHILASLCSHHAAAGKHLAYLRSLLRMVSSNAAVSVCAARHCSAGSGQRLA